MNFQEARSTFQADKPLHESRGVVMPLVTSYIPEGWKMNFNLAMDAQPSLSTDPNSAVPAMLTTMIDPQIYEILFSPNKAAIIFGEQKKGTWLDETTMFPTVEHTGEVSSYGDYSENGVAGANTAWPARQSYLFQVMLEYGERELDRAGLARINWVSELEASAAAVMNKFSNLSYFFGVQGLQNYGALNDPNLSAPLTPSVKAAGGNTWIKNGAINATANEVYEDIQALFLQLVVQSGGIIEATDKLVLAMSPGSAVALTATNTFNVNVYDLLKKNYPNIRFETAVQYGEVSASNPQGVVGGNLVQMIAESVEGKQSAYSAFNEKMRAHKLIPASSSFKLKLTGGTWGTVIRRPFAISQMLGV